MRSDLLLRLLEKAAEAPEPGTPDWGSIGKTILKALSKSEPVTKVQDRVVSKLDKKTKGIQEYLGLAEAPSADAPPVTRTPNSTTPAQGSSVSKDKVVPPPIIQYPPAPSTTRPSFLAPPVAPPAEAPAPTTPKSKLIPTSIDTTLPPPLLPQDLQRATEMGILPAHPTVNGLNLTWEI